jgi:hypothetical protein
MQRVLRSSQNNNNNNQNKIVPIVPTYTVNIDFDESINSWNANKKKSKNGLYKYICESFTKNSKKCNRICYEDSHNCYQHKKSEKNASMFN